MPPSAPDFSSRPDRLALQSLPQRNENPLRGRSLLPLDPCSRASPGSTPIIRNLRGECILQLPTLDPRITKLAAQITTAQQIPTTKPRESKRYLKTHYAYTLDLTDPHGKDPLAYFLFDRRAGHCEYFASAMTDDAAHAGNPGALRHRISPRRIQRRRRRLHHSRQRRARLGGSLLSRTTAGSLSIPRRLETQKPAACSSASAMYWDWFQFAWSEWIVNYDFVTSADSRRRTCSAHRTIWSDRARNYYHREAAPACMR